MRYASGPGCSRKRNSSERDAGALRRTRSGDRGFRAESSRRGARCGRSATVSGRGRMIADPHRPNALSVGWAEGPVVVAKQMTWRFMMIASRSDGYNLYGLTNSTRSIFHILTRLGDLRRGTDSCWRRTRFSASSRARHANQDRVTSSSWVRNAPSAASLNTRPQARHPGEVFGRHRAISLRACGSNFPRGRWIDQHHLVC
jgi:hypothetical protein